MISESYECSPEIVFFHLGARPGLAIQLLGQKCFNPMFHRLPGERDIETSLIFENLLNHGPKFGFVAKLIHPSMFAALPYKS